MMALAAGWRRAAGAFERLLEPFGGDAEETPGEVMGRRERIRRGERPPGHANRADELTDGSARRMKPAREVDQPASGQWAQA